MSLLLRRLVGGPQQVTLVPATEADSAQILNIDKNKTLVPALESGAAQVLNVDKLVTHGFALETDVATAITLSGPIVVNLLPAEEFDEAKNFIALAKVVTLGQVSEANVAQGLSIDKAISISFASESDQAIPISISAGVVFQAWKTLMGVGR